MNWQHLTFDSTIEDPPKGDEPAGHQHAKLLQVALSTKFELLHEGLYNDAEHERWDFECRVNAVRIRLSILADFNAGGFDKGKWQTDMIPCGLLKVFHRKRIYVAFEELANAVKHFFANDARFSNFHHYTDEKFKTRNMALS